MERITHAFILVRRRLTKPLSFADCVGDELPWGWEAGFDPQIGVYYIDHVNSKFLFFMKVIPSPDLESNKNINALYSELLHFKPHFLSD